MIEPPSKQLSETLIKLKLCTRGDFRRCRGRVRRLAHDLPAFDSIWIDALLQARKLTPFQARMLESSTPERLAVGPCLLVEQMGHGPSAKTFLARRRDGNERCVLKLIDQPPESLETGHANLNSLISQLRQTPHPSIVGPHTALRHNNQLVTVSRYVSGPHLGELLVRRGRFPASVVTDLASQLIDGMARLEEEGAVHGDIRLSNVRLTSAGVAVLVDCGIQPALSKRFSIHANLSPERCDTMAPELIGTGNLATSVSEIYAIGCLLWQLLAGRPPFTTADPLAKLASHQTRTIEDVREKAPDTSDRLAELVRAFTKQSPLERPQSFREVRENWMPPRRAGRKRLVQFNSRFTTVAPTIHQVARKQSSGRWTLYVLMLFVLTGAALTMFDTGATSFPLALRDLRTRLTGGDRLEPPGNDRAEETAAQQAPPQGREMPEADAQGTIVLHHNGPYQWKRIDWVGRLTIRGKPGLQAEILVGREPCIVVADQLILENLNFHRTDHHKRDDETSRALPNADADRSTPLLHAEIQNLLRVETQNLSIRNCRFQIAGAVESARATEFQRAAFVRAAAVDWRLIDPDDRSGGQLEIGDTLFAGIGCAVSTTSVPTQIEIKNCLKLGPGALLRLSAGEVPKHPIYVKLQRVTLRKADALIQIGFASGNMRTVPIGVEAIDCIFDLVGPHAALLQLFATRAPKRVLSSIEVIGRHSLITKGVEAAAWINPHDNRLARIESDAIVIEGFFAKSFRFVGPFSFDPRDSMIEVTGRRNGSRRPAGIDANRFP